MKEVAQDPAITGLVKLYTPVVGEERDHGLISRREYATYAGVALPLGTANLFFANCTPDTVLECYTSSANLFPLIGGTALTLGGFVSLGLAGYKTLKKHQYQRVVKGVGDDSYR